MNVGEYVCAAGEDSDINLRNIGTKGTPIDLQLYTFRSDRTGMTATLTIRGAAKTNHHYTRTGVLGVLMRARFYSKWVGPYTDPGLKQLIQCGVKRPRKQQVKVCKHKAVGVN